MFAPLVASQQGRANQHEPVCFELYPLFGPSRHVRAYDCMPYSSPGFSAAINFAMKCSAPCSTVLRHFPPSYWAAVFHWSALMPKALKSSRKHPIHSSFSCASTQPATPTNSRKIPHLGSLASSKHATNSPHLVYSRLDALTSRLDKR